MSATKQSQRSVGIVGAGFAGLRCAAVLLQRGHRVTVFEGRDRIGGRVAQSDHLGTKVDLGPNWIHGTVGNPISKLAEKTETRLHDWDERSKIYDTDSTPLTGDEAGTYAQMLWDDGLISQAFDLSRNRKRSIPPDQSLFDFFREKAQGLFKDHPEIVAEKKRATLLEISRMWGAYVGSPIEQQSLRFFWLEECIEGENPFVAETYHKILQEVARPVLENDVIRLNTKIVKISRRNSGDGGNEQLATLITDDGVKHTFDDIVVTAPLGWLKRNQSAFVPKLESKLSQAIEHIGYGCLDKVYITFPRAFWQDHCEGGASYPGFTHWLSPSYDSKHNPHRWDVQAMNMAALPDPLGHPTLLFYVQGPCSQHIASLVRSATSQAGLDATLTAWFKPYFSLLPNYDADDTACTPKAVLATAWANDELAGYGSYSNFQVGLEAGDEDIVAMRHGMPERGLWFAGEHTAPFVALGTTTGAYWSGEAVAERIDAMALGEGDAA